MNRVLDQDATRPQRHDDRLTQFCGGGIMKKPVKRPALPKIRSDFPLSEELKSLTER
jgi:hypothetical protein